jgi:hypothetical protein
MTREELAKWELDAKNALLRRYREMDVHIILDWFRRIKGSDEYDLIGHDRLEAFGLFSQTEVGKFCLYDSLMARLWIYAPLILKEHEEYEKRTSPVF